MLASEFGVLIESTLFLTRRLLVPAHSFLRTTLRCLSTSRQLDVNKIPSCGEVNQSLCQCVESFGSRNVEAFFMQRISSMGVGLI